MNPTEPLRGFGRVRRWFCGSVGYAGRWTGKTRDWSERGPTQVAVFVREVARVVAVYLASYGGWQRPCESRPTTHPTDTTEPLPAFGRGRSWFCGSVTIFHNRPGRVSDQASKVPVGTN
jgi:hypothetical protein